MCVPGEPRVRTIWSNGVKNGIFCAKIEQNHKASGSHQKQQTLADSAGLEGIKKTAELRSRIYNGGERGIRTLDTLTRITVFETVPFNHSGISPNTFMLA